MGPSQWWGTQATEEASGGRMGAQLGREETPDLCVCLAR